MQFRTEIDWKYSGEKRSYQELIVSVGSCFAENIGRKLEILQHQTSINPLGISFNPINLARLISNGLNKDVLNHEELFLSSNGFAHFDYHSSLNSKTKEIYTSTISKLNNQIVEELSKAKLLLVTFGTSWGFEKNEGGSLVNNCHKIPQDQFSKKLIPSSEIIDIWLKLIHQLKEINPELEIIFTISPVRHWKDGAIENQRSKSNLIVSIHEIIEQTPNTFYFPAYEFLMDDLRDYRFYQSDLLHPSETAIDYIWDKFRHEVFTTNTIRFQNRVEKIVKASQHRAFSPDSEEYIRFLDKTKLKLNQLELEIGISLEKINDLLR